MSKRPKHRRFLCKGCTHGLEHHPARGACRYGHSREDGGTSCGPAGEGSPAGGCRCPAFNTPKNRIPAADVGDVSARAAAGKARIMGDAPSPEAVSKHLLEMVAIAEKARLDELELARLDVQAALDLFCTRIKKLISPTRGGAASISPPQVDAVRSRGRARRKEDHDAAPPVKAPTKLLEPALVRTPPPAPPRGAIAGTVDGVIVEQLDDATVALAPVSVGARAILRAIALSEDGCSDGRLSLETGYKATSRKTYVQQLRARGLIEKDGARHILSPAGVTATMNILRRKAGELREALPVGERTMLDAIAAAGTDGATDARLAVVTHYKPTSRKTYLSALVLRELVEVLDGRRCLTGLGMRETAEARTPAMKPAELLEHYISTLPEGESLILQVLRDAAEPHTAGEIGAATSYAPTSVKTYLAKLRARELVVTEGGKNRLAPELVS